MKKCLKNVEKNGFGVFVRKTRFSHLRQSGVIGEWLPQKKTFFLFLPRQNRTKNEETQWFLHQIPPGVWGVVIGNFEKCIRTSKNVFWAHCSEIWSKTRTPNVPFSLELRLPKGA